MHSFFFLPIYPPEKKTQIIAISFTKYNEHGQEIEQKNFSKSNKETKVAFVEMTDTLLQLNLQETALKLKMPPEFVPRGDFYSLSVFFSEGGKTSFLFSPPQNYLSLSRRERDALDQLIVLYRDPERESNFLSFSMQSTDFFGAKKKSNESDSDEEYEPEERRVSKNLPAKKSRTVLPERKAKTRVINKPIDPAELVVDTEENIKRYKGKSEQYKALQTDRTLNRFMYNKTKGLWTSVQFYFEQMINRNYIVGLRLFLKSKKFSSVTDPVLTQLLQTDDEFKRYYTDIKKGYDNDVEFFTKSGIQYQKCQFPECDGFAALYPCVCSKHAADLYPLLQISPSRYVEEIFFQMGKSRNAKPYGLFARQDIEKGTIIGVYYAVNNIIVDVLNYHTVKRQSDYVMYCPYDASDTYAYLCDANSTQDSICRWANSSKEFTNVDVVIKGIPFSDKILKQTGEKYRWAEDASNEQNPFVAFPVFIASDNIKKGSELLIDYGDEYFGEE